MPRNFHRFHFLAILSDIHANIDALEAVLADMRQFEITETICLGDIVGYGPEPAACVDRIASVAKVNVYGNHEAMLLLGEDLAISGWRATVDRPLSLARKQLSSAQTKWLSELPLIANLREMSFSHASLHHPEDFDYVHEIPDAETHFRAQRHYVSFQGHTHVPGVWERSGQRIVGHHALEVAVRLNPVHRFAVNVGSVGQSRDGDTRACYALYDEAHRVLLHRRVPYDLDTAVARFKKAGLPQFNYRRLWRGE